MKVRRILALWLLLIGWCASAKAQEKMIQVTSVEQLAQSGSQSGQSVKMAPGVYKMADYLSEKVLEKIRQEVPKEPGRPPVWMINFSGNNNRFDLSGVVIEIDTALYARLPRGYTRCLFVSGNNNSFGGLTIRNTGVNQGSGGNILSIFGNGNTLENIHLYVHGSKPYGYGDLLGKGGPNLISLQKQSGVMVTGRDNTLRRCRVISRAFGHCFYIQGGVNVRLEDCYAEGVMRSTNDMLRDTSGPAFDLGFRSVYQNRDGRFMITPGYTKSLVEDGFRTYGGGPNGSVTGNVSLINCIAINTRAGFEISGSETGETKTILENSMALGCERGYLLGSNIIVRNGRGDISNGPLLYLRGGKDSDVEVELTGEGSNSTVHALATIAGSNHRVRFFRHEPLRQSPQVPIMLGFGMPEHAEMASPIRPAAAQNIRLINELPGVMVIRSAEAGDSVVGGGMVRSDEETKALGSARGAWPQPATQQPPALNAEPAK